MSYDPARTIARQMRQLRIQRGWTQEEAGALLAEHGIKWSAANWSARERGAETDRVPAFTAAEVIALADLFEVNPGRLFGIESLCDMCKGSLMTYEDGYRAGLEAAWTAVRQLVETQGVSR